MTFSLPLPSSDLKVHNLQSSGNDDNGDGNKNVTWKYCFILFVPLRDYFNSCNFRIKTTNYPGTKVAGATFELFEERRNENVTVVNSRSPPNLEFGHFTLFFCRGRQRNVQNLKTHVQSYCFSSLRLCSHETGSKWIQLIFCSHGTILVPRAAWPS